MTALEYLNNPENGAYVRIFADNNMGPGSDERLSKKINTFLNELRRRGAIIKDIKHSMFECRYIITIIYEHTEEVVSEGATL